MLAGIGIQFSLGRFKFASEAIIIGHSLQLFLLDRFDTIVAAFASVQRFLVGLPEFVELPS